MNAERQRLQRSTTEAITACRETRLTFPPSIMNVNSNTCNDCDKKVCEDCFYFRFSQKVGSKSDNF